MQRIPDHEFLTAWCCCISFLIIESKLAASSRYPAWLALCGTGAFATLYLVDGKVGSMVPADLT